MPVVLNKRRDGCPRGAAYIGRPSKWGNPFVIGADGTRDEVGGNCAGGISYVSARLRDVMATFCWRSRTAGRTRPFASTSRVPGRSDGRSRRQASHSRRHH